MATQPQHDCATRTAIPSETVVYTSGLSDEPKPEVKSSTRDFLRWVRGVKWLRTMVSGLFRPPAPRLPAWLKPLFRFLYNANYWLQVLSRWLITVFWRHPAFQSVCAHIGKNLALDGLPFVVGPVQIHIGDNCYLGGKIGIFSGLVRKEPPQLILEDHAEIGWNSVLVVNQLIHIGAHARVSYDCRIGDSDGHPREADLRAENKPMAEKDIHPVHIGAYAWIGNGTHIMKGVTIGEGAVIGANSVVIQNIPPYCLALGNPAEVILRNYGKPSKKPAVNPPA